MCDYADNVISMSTKSQKPWNPLCNYLTKKCNCPHCQIKYTKISAILKIRNEIRRKLKTVNNNSRNLKSISDNEIYYHQQKWMIPLYGKLNDLDVIYKTRI